MNNFQYNNSTYENATKRHEEYIYNGTFYVEGYCDMKQGRVFFKGDIGGISEAQARFYIVYLLRDKYGEEVWINPIFYKINKCVNKKVKDRKLIFDLKRYEDGKLRNFIPFNNHERQSMIKVKEDVGHLMPQIIESPLYNLGTSVDDIKTSYIKNNLVTSNTNWNRDHLTSSFENVSMKYESLDNSTLASNIEFITLEDILDEALEILETSLEDYMPYSTELIKVGNTIYDINDLTDIVHYSKMVPVINKHNEQDLLQANKDLEASLFRVNDFVKKTSKYISDYMEFKIVFDLEVLTEFYISSLNELNKIYCYTYDLKSYGITISSLYETYRECINVFNLHLELQGYTYSSSYADKLRLLNEELLNAITIKIRLIVKHLIFSAMSLYNL